MNDYSEALKRIYIYLDRLDKLAGTSNDIKLCAHSIRVYVDEIAKSVDYEEEDDE